MGGQSILGENRKVKKSKQKVNLVTAATLKVPIHNDDKRVQVANGVRF